jgi:RHS repeat-associated protein
LVFNYSPANGTLTSLVGPDGGVLAFTYLGNRITQQAWSGGISGSVTYTYDKNDRIASRSVNSAAPVTLTFDNDGFVTRAGNLTLTRSATTGLPAGSSLAVVSDTISYDAFGDVSGYSAAAGGSPIFAVAYTRDKLGRITARTETIGGQTESLAYTFDLAGNLSEVKKNGLSVASYAYDLNNNRIGATVSGVASSAAYDAQDRLKTHGSATYVFSKDGQLVSRTTGPDTTQYAYDELGNLRTVALPSGTRIDYLTDGLNRRIGRKVNGTLVQGFLYEDDLRVVAELNGAGGLVSEFIYGSQVNVPDYMIKEGVSYRLISDHAGSPRLIVNAANGEIVQRLDYDEFGRVVLDTNPGFQPFGFAGGLYDSATGLVRFGARDYDAETGRWTARDPILFGGADLNLYGYALNDPINRTDLAGLLPGTKNFRKYLKDKAVDFIKGQITDLAKQLAETEAKKCLSKKQREEIEKRLKELNELLELAKFLEDPRAAIADKACEEVGKFLEKQWQEFLKQAEAARAGAERNLRETIEKLIIPKQ